MASPIPVPEGTPVKRTLHFFWLSGAKIATLNQAIHYRTLSQHGDISLNPLNQTAFISFPAGHWVKSGSSYIPP
jgi:hypothetical protein